MENQNIIKSNLDNKNYKSLTLSNKLRVLLIHDPEADKSACSLGVGVGASLDPRPLEGVAHFLEHMLF